MTTNQFGEKINQFHNTSIKNSQIFTKLNTDVTKKLTEINSSLVNCVTKNMQSSAVNLLNTKKLANPWGAIKSNGNGSFMQELEDYQHHLNEAISDYMEEFTDANEQLLEDSKAAFNEFVQLSSQSAPDGMDTLIKPYQTMMGSWFEGAAIVNGLSKSYVDNIKKNFSENMKSSKNLILSSTGNK